MASRQAQAPELALALGEMTMGGRVHPSPRVLQVILLL